MTRAVRSQPRLSTTGRARGFSVPTTRRSAVLTRAWATVRYGCHGEGRCGGGHSGPFGDRAAVPASFRRRTVARAGRGGQNARHALRRESGPARSGGGPGTAGRTLAGIAYGHTWRWPDEDYPWATELSERLGDAAGLLDGSTALCLLAVAPDHRGRGLGRALLNRITSQAGGRLWLVTRDEDTVARQLYERSGWHVLGYGPDAPNGTPGLVLTKRRRATGDGGWGRPG